MNTDQDKFLYKLGAILFFVIAAIISLIHIFQINYQLFLLPCLFYKLTSIYCPGCGGTRSVQSMMQGHILSSIRYNPIVFYGLIVYAWYMISHTIELLSRQRIKIGMKYRDLYFWIGLGILLVFFIIRNILLLVFRIDLNAFS